jgi:YidC/Oxa1 family membrane protein insertase
MEKRLILAVLLMSATILVTNLLFPPPDVAPDVPTDAGADSVAVMDSAGPALAPAVAAPVAAWGRADIDTVTVRSPLYTFAFSTRGAALILAELAEYQSYTRDGPVQLVPEGADHFLSYRIVVGGDTIDLRDLPFQTSSPTLAVGGERSDSVVTFSYSQPAGFGVSIEYSFSPETYLIGVRGRVTGLSRPASLLIEMGPGLAPHEAPDHHGEQQLAMVVRSVEGVDRMQLSKLEGTQRVPASLSWAGIKDKYFLAAIIAGESRPMTGAVLRDLPDSSLRYADSDEQVSIPQGELIAALPVGGDGTFSFQTYLGPQDFVRLRAVGYDLENVTQYAYRWLEPVIRPVAAAILWVLEALHDTLGLAYGWVLVLFGVIMRIVLWPLNTKAMRAQMKNMGVQPLMQEIREKYKDQPEKQQAELVKLYKEHGFNPLAGCLPLLVPFPVLITLFFVFQNTIAFRGADFLWLPDLSLRDPIYLLPLFLVISMFGLQWISMKSSGMETNPQMKMMLYFMPLMMGILFFTLPAGLNLYYATTNVASIPQQILIGRERKRAKAVMDAEAAPKKSSPRGAKPRTKRKARG